MGLGLGLVHRTARLDRRWARCVRRACTAPPYSVWRRLLCAAHRGRHSRTPNPARCQHVASTPGIGHRLRCCTSRLLTEPRRGGPRRCSRRGSRRLAQPPPVRSASVVKQRDACGCRWPHARGARHGQGRHPAGAMPEPRRASKRARRGGPRRCSRRRARRLAQPPPPVRSASVVKQRDVCGCRWPHTRGARHGQGRHPAGAMPEPRRASKRARRACRGMPEPAWRSPDAGYVQGRLRLRSCRQTAPQGQVCWGDRETPGTDVRIGVKRYTRKNHRFATTLTG